VKKIYLLYLSLIILLLTGCVAENTSAKAKSEKSIWQNTRYEPVNVAMKLIQVSPHAYYVQGKAGTAIDNEGFISNAGVIITNEGVVVFDSLGTPSLAYLLLSKIREITDKPIVKVVASHYHADHIYGLQVFKELGAKIIAPNGAKVYLASDASRNRLKERRESLFPWVDENTHIVPPDHFVTKRESFRLGGLDFIITPLGSTHSDGDMTLYIKQDKVLFAGDLIFQGRIPFVAGSQPINWINHLENLNVAGLNVIVPGHGPASVHPAEAVKFTLGYLHFLYNKMSDAVENLVSFDEAYKSVDWSTYKKYPAFQANHMNAYYIYLAIEASSLK
jgi:glyoxylase-like metal-dependent hydrolase (beta-lactamase superfamily II)